MLNDHSNKAELFRSLHVPGNPLVLFNIWDAGSAKCVAKAGARVIATSSWSVAKSHGFEDGENVPLELVLQNLRRIVEAVDLPVTVDLESGYGERPEKVAECISLAIEVGSVGCNLEDSVPKTGAVRDIVMQAARIEGARKAAKALNVPFFINARCDLFFQGDSIPHDQALLAKVVERAQVYAKAGADGLFVPGLKSLSLISKLAEQSPIPVNILADPSLSLRALADSGVSRVSYGATPYAQLMNVMEQSALAVVK